MVKRGSWFLLSNIGCIIVLALSACTFDASGVAATPNGANEEPFQPPNVEPDLGCNGGCHGDDYSVAPPKDLQGNTATTGIGVGAHRAHLQAAPNWYRKVVCEDCHTVPASIDAPGHQDGDNTAELTFGARATDNGALSPNWDGTTCQNAYCHGATLAGGTDKTPAWTSVTGGAPACDTCHGYPPPAPHEQIDDCSTCHPTVEPGDLPGPDSFLDPASHMNNVVDTVEGEPACDYCHGSNGQSAPPTDLDDNTEVTSPGVGAHRAHVGPSNWRRQLFCVQCHIVPVAVDSPGHRDDGDNLAEINFDNLNPAASYSRANATCSDLYCHSNGWNALGTMEWTQDLPQLGCDACHSDNGAGMSGKHYAHLHPKRGQPLECVECHATVIDAQRVFIDPELHINGQYEVVLDQGGTYNVATQRCSNTNTACHNRTRDWERNGHH